MCGLLLGLRVSEICSLRVGDVDLDERTVFVNQGKGKKDRFVAMPDRLAAPLGDFLGARRAGWLFTSYRGNKLTSRTIQLMVQRLSGEAGILRRISPHSLRHSFATQLLSTGADIFEIQQLLGHASISTTSIYLHCSTDRLKAAVNRL